MTSSNPRRGGEAARTGFVYEDYVAIQHMAGLLDGRAIAFQLEGATPEKFEFRVDLPNGGTRVTQVKRRASGKRWTLNAMSSEDGLLNAIAGWLRVPSNEVVFVSNGHCDLGRLADAARETETEAEFRSEVQRLRLEDSLTAVSYTHLTLPTILLV